MKRLFTILWLGLSTPTFAAATFQLSHTNGAYTLIAKQAVLGDILAEIDRLEPAALRFYGAHDRVVSATHRDVSLGTLLDRLGVSYVLTYEADGVGNFRMGDALMLDSDGMGVDAATAAAIQKLIRDLRNDDIPGNARKAISELSQLGSKAVPFLEEALHDEDFQCRQVAADLLRNIDPEYQASDLLIEVTFELLDTDDLDYNMKYLLTAWRAVAFLEGSNMYPRVRGRILQNLYSNDSWTRLYSALMAARQGETEMAETLVRIMVPHLADNDLDNDASACTYAIHHLGPVVLPYLRPYRESTDVQQAELVNLIYASLETGNTPEFKPVMYASYTRMPIHERSHIYLHDWSRDRFPDDTGRYHDLYETRRTVADYYGAKYNSSYNDWREEERRLEELFKGSHIGGHNFDPEDNLPAHQTVEEPFPYTVKQSDTLDSIAIRFSASKSDIISINPKLPPDGTVEPGMVLRIPWQ